MSLQALLMRAVGPAAYLQYTRALRWHAAHSPEKRQSLPAFSRLTPGEASQSDTLSFLAPFDGKLLLADAEGKLLPNQHAVFVDPAPTPGTTTSGAAAPAPAGASSPSGAAAAAMVVAGKEPLFLWVSVVSKAVRRSAGPLVVGVHRKNCSSMINPHYTTRA